MTTGAHADVHPFLRFLSLRLAPHIHQAPYFWNINAIEINDGELTIDGWALPFAGERFNVALDINGKKVSELKFHKERKLLDNYTWWPNAELAAFRASVPLEFLSGETELELAVRPRIESDLAAVGNEYSRTYFASLIRPLTLPPRHLLTTIGTESPFFYQMSGLTLFKHYSKILEQCTGMRFEQIGRVLDWGCGPGRVAGHISRAVGGANLAGADIVQESIEFANSTIAGTFKTCDTAPPLPFGDGEFDVVVAYSVLTHVPGNLARPWVSEIARVLKPGGLFLTTILGELAYACFNRGREDETDDWLSAGCADTVQNAQLAGTGVNEDYYRNVWLTKHQVRSIVDGHFAIERIQENFHFYQDVLALKKL